MESWLRPDPSTDYLQAAAILADETLVPGPLGACRWALPSVPRVSRVLFESGALGGLTVGLRRVSQSLWLRPLPGPRKQDASPLGVLEPIFGESLRLLAEEIMGKVYQTIILCVFPVQPQQLAHQVALLAGLAVLCGAERVAWAIASPPGWTGWDMLRRRLTAQQRETFRSSSKSSHVCCANDDDVMPRIGFNFPGSVNGSGAGARYAIGQADLTQLIPGNAN